MPVRTIYCALIYSFAFIPLVYSANPIVVISIDGLRPDAIEKAKAKNLLNLIATGTSFANARTVRPSITLPAHTSMLTGLDPDQHGIFWDEYLPAYGPVRFKTALEIANNAGLHTALIVAKDKLLHLNRPNSVDYFEKTDKEGEQVALAFKRYVSLQGLPDVTFLHLPDPDSQGHKLVWMSKFYLNGVKDADNAVGSILETANAASPDRPPTVIVTADHGGFGFGHLSDIDANNEVPFIAHGENIASGTVKLDRVRAYDVGATMLFLLGLEIPETWMGKPAPILIGASDTMPPMSLGKSSFFGLCQENSSY
jgi:arylsulfatase A-like enzyme